MLSGAVLVAASLLLTACGGSDSKAASKLSTAGGDTKVEATAPPAASAPKAPAPTTVPAPALIPLQPDGNRVLADIKYLSETIGQRAAGGPSERAAADWAADRFRSLGYEVSFQEFPAGGEATRTSTLNTGGRMVASAPFERTASGDASGTLVLAGKGNPDEIPAAGKGAILLVERGDLLFVDKVGNAQAAGAKGVIIYNNAPGLYYGSLNRDYPIPAISISQDEGKKLIDALGKGAVTADLSVSPIGDSISRNVIAKPPGKDCETVSGGHYDSVIQAPGANDNASGSATVLEMAKVIASRGEMRNNCFVLFGGEELGLYGSRAYVKSLDTQAHDRIKAMLNFDMTGFGSVGWIFIGTPELQTKAKAIATQLGVNDAFAGGLPRNSSSDHASFIQAGIPALFYYRSEDSALHTPQDTAGRLNPTYLEQAASMGVTMLEQISSGA